VLYVTGWYDIQTMNLNEKNKSGLAMNQIPVIFGLLVGCSGSLLGVSNVRREYLCQGTYVNGAIYTVQFTTRI